MTQKAVVKELNRHRDRNRQLKARFQERNLDLDESRAIEFHFWTWTQRDAAVLERSLNEMGFLVRLLAPAPAADDPDRWAVEAGARIPLTKALGDELAEKLVKLAVAEGAVFDGWGTSV